jgi:hypothetical protein
MQKRRRQLVRIFIVPAEVPVEQHGAKRCVSSSDCAPVLQRQSPDDLHVARFQRRGDILSSSAKSSFAIGQRVVDNEGTRPKWACSWIQHG